MADKKKQQLPVAKRIARIMEKEDEITCCVTTCGFPLNSNYWEAQYQNNETGWDLHEVSPPLKLYIDTLTDKELRILIPGCGNAYEAEYLLQKGFKNVTLIDISATLVQRLQQKFKGQPVRIIHGDFFEHNEQYDLILEQTFFCALNPSLRQRYAAKCFELLKEGGQIAGLLFNRQFEKEGPPFGGNKEEYVALFEPLFLIKQMDVCQNSVKPRAGTELFIEMKKRPVNEVNAKLYRISGITCSGCKNTITQHLNKVPGVIAASINSDFTEVLITSSTEVPLSALREAITYDKHYQLNEL